MTTKNGSLGGGGRYKAVGEAEEEGKCGGRRGRGYWKGDGMATVGGNHLLPAARRKGHGEVVGKKIGRAEEDVCPKCGEE